MTETHTFWLASASYLQPGWAQRCLSALDHFLPKSCQWYLRPTPLLLLTGLGVGVGNGLSPSPFKLRSWGGEKATQNSGLSEGKPLRSFLPETTLPDSKPAKKGLLFVLPDHGNRSALCCFQSPKWSS